ncbi:MAG: branched-chain amino acid aminotransferase [Flavobacteriales bacterium]|nr:branched-chain amino acid aminotransferase [Flavobacteriales bacterium]MCC6939364.1 branched-chain amino acid aminotransferase [Flavobacteriales bacterium]
MITTGQKIAIQRTAKSRLPETDLENIKFGRVFSDHMVVMDFEDGAWKAPAIMPFGDLKMSPAALVLHYSQTIFEGLKAYRNVNGGVNLIRPKANIARMNRSAKRMCMPPIPEDVILDAMIELVRLDQDWIPKGDDAALYIRPFMFASDQYLGVRPSDGYRLIIFTCPVRGYYSEPVKVKVETHFSRAFPGGTGEAKCGGNYAGALYPSKVGMDEGYHQLLWTDGLTHKYFEESGTMNVFFNVDGTLVTPALDGTILRGITRDSIIKIAADEGIRVEERQVSVEEIEVAAKNGRLRSAFGAGTAATIAHIQSIAFNNAVYDLPDVSTRDLANLVGTKLDDIRRGRIADPYDWVVPI